VAYWLIASGDYEAALQTLLRIEELAANKGPDSPNYSISCRAALLALMAHGRASHHEVCRSLLDQFTRTRTPQIASDVARICFLVPSEFGIDDLRKLNGLVVLVRESIDSAADLQRCWFHLTLGMERYRASDWQSAAEHLRRAIGGTTAGLCCGTGFVLTNPGLGNGQSSREASTTVIEDTATWIKGKHNVTFGGSMVQADVWLQNQTLVPTVTFGLIGSESANSMFSAANFPGASTTDLQNATSLYAMLTGRIASIQGDARINPAGDAYVPLGLSKAEGRMREFDFFAADSWRVTPSVTVSAGLRYVLALPFYPTNNSYTTVTDESLYGISGVGNLFKSGTLTGTKPTYVQYLAGTYAYNTDRNNLAPSGGVAWQLPGHDRGFARLLLGSEEGDSVIRGGGAMAFQRPGMSDFTGAFGANQGIPRAQQQLSFLGERIVRLTWSQERID
jgi:hypothetical protein